MNEGHLSPALQQKLVDFATALVDQERACILVPPNRNAPGFWFGGGNLIQDHGGALILAGRYRNAGDSRTGLGAGERGLELAVFRAGSFADPFEKIASFRKTDLGAGGKRVISIEGVSLLAGADGVELFVSSEKEADYPAEVAAYQKPGTGIWSIGVLRGDSLETLDPARLERVLDSTDPGALHVKDPVASTRPNGDTAVIFCTHPFCWTSTNTGLAVRARGDQAFRVVTGCLLPRGATWDVAVTRVTDRLPVPRLGAFAGLPALSLYFYDGAECVRRHDPGAAAVARPRGYSCEEIGGLAWGFDADLPHLERLSLHRPLFVSPMGTGCSRYVSTLVTADAVYATWQQSRDDLSQPLVGHVLALEEVERILS